VHADGKMLREGDKVEYTKVWDNMRNKDRADQVTGGHPEPERGYGGGGGYGGRDDYRGGGKNFPLYSKGGLGNTNSHALGREPETAWPRPTRLCRRALDCAQPGNPRVASVSTSSRMQRNSD
jgi:hypothetical protein